MRLLLYPCVYLLFIDLFVFKDRISYVAKAAIELLNLCSYLYSKSWTYSEAQLTDLCIYFTHFSFLWSIWAPVK